MLTKDFELAVYNVIIQIESFVNCENFVKTCQYLLKYLPKAFIISVTKQGKTESG